MTNCHVAWQILVMPFRLPYALQLPSDDAALELLKRYFGRPYLLPGCAEGAYFDTFIPESDPNRFTTVDLVAIRFLSIDLPALARVELLRHRAERLSALLVELGPDRDLVDEVQELADDWVGWRLMNELRSIDGIGPTTASKLLASKRPRLRPIWDSVVAAVTDTVQAQWEPVRVALREDGCALHHRLVRLRADAGIPDVVSALRILDAIAWREGKDRGL